MSYVQLIYNPMAGQRMFPGYLDMFLEAFQKQGYEVRIHRTMNPDDFGSVLMNRDMTDCGAVIVAGGDGSVNQVVNAMLTKGLDVPLGVVPAGTANDFAVHLGTPTDQIEAIHRLARMNIDSVDVGKVNGRYFVNVCSGGLFTNISSQIDIDFKNTLGKLAYYIKGVQQLPTFTKLRLRIDYEEGTVEDDFYLFLLLNGSSAGGFNRLGYNADIADGKMDFVGIRACHVGEIPTLFGKILLGEHLYDKNILFFQSSRIKIECLEGAVGFEKADIDGELGPDFPLEIDVLHKGLKIIQTKL